MKSRARRILIRTTPSYAKYRLADELETDEALVSETAPTPRMVPRIDMGRILKWSAKIPRIVLPVTSEVA